MIRTTPARLVEQILYWPFGKIGGSFFTKNKIRPKRAAALQITATLRFMWQITQAPEPNILMNPGKASPLMQSEAS